MATDELALAEEDPESGLSALTRFMVEGLRGAADVNRDGIVTLNELSKYVQLQVASNYNQKPTEAGPDIQGEVAISRSGIEPEAERRARVKERLLEWSNSNLIATEILAEALAVLEKGTKLDSDREIASRTLLDRIVEEGIDPGPFQFAWFKVHHMGARRDAKRAAEPSEPAPEKPAPHTFTQGIAGGTDAHTKSAKSSAREFAEPAAKFDIKDLDPEPVSEFLKAVARSQQPGTTAGMVVWSICIVILASFANLMALGFAIEAGMADGDAFLLGIVAVPLAFLLWRIRDFRFFRSSGWARGILAFGSIGSIAWAALLSFASLNAF